MGRIREQAGDEDPLRLDLVMREKGATLPGLLTGGQSESCAGVKITLCTVRTAIATQTRFSGVQLRCREAGLLQHRWRNFTWTEALLRLRRLSEHRQHPVRNS